MKIVNRKIQDNFKPFEVVIEVETKEDLKTLYGIACRDETIPRLFDNDNRDHTNYNKVKIFIRMLMQNVKDEYKNQIG